MHVVSRLTWIHTAVIGSLLFGMATGILIATLWGAPRASAQTPGAPMPGMPGTPMGSPQAPPPPASLPPTPMGSVTQMNGMVLPPGMVMAPDMSMNAMKDMAAVDLSKIAYTAPPDARGDQALDPTTGPDGVKTFNLEVSLITWNILPDRQVAAYAFNRQVPGPRIHIVEGDKVRMVVKNSLPDPTSVHWHGLVIPNAMDGVADVTQLPIPPGATFTYEFQVQQRGTYFYHSHTDADRQQGLGMYGALIIDPKDPSGMPAADKDLDVLLGEWTVRQGYTFPAMPMEGLLPNFFTINGKSYPATDTVDLKVGQKLRVRFIGSQNAFIHPMHIHGGPFTIIETDGNPVPPGAQLAKDTVNVGPGERYDVIWPARLPGKWLLHCHINHHITNDNTEAQGGGGLTLVLSVTP